MKLISTILTNRKLSDLSIGYLHPFFNINRDTEVHRKRSSLKISSPFMFWVFLVASWWLEESNSWYSDCVPLTSILPLRDLIDFFLKHGWALQSFFRKKSHRNMSDGWKIVRLPVLSLAHWGTNSNTQKAASIKLKIQGENVDCVRVPECVSRYLGQPIVAVWLW